MLELRKLQEFAKRLTVNNKILNPDDISKPIVDAIQDKSGSDNSKIDRILANIEKVKGDPGKTPVAGEDYMSKKQSQAMIEDLVEKNIPIPGRDFLTDKEMAKYLRQITPMKGRDYFDGEDGYTPVAGKDYFTEKEKQSFIDRLHAEIEVPEVDFGHRWEGTKLFLRINGEWDGGVDLKGDPGEGFPSGGGGGGNLTFASMMDVNINDPSDGQILKYDASSSQWYNANNTGGSGGHTIQEEGSDLTARTYLNFIGDTVTAADDSGNDATTVTISSDLADYDNSSSNFFDTAGSGLASSGSEVSLDINGLTEQGSPGSGDFVVIYDVGLSALRKVDLDNLPGGGGGGGSMDDFTLDADSGTPETIEDGNTLTIAGGTGIGTVVGATDTVTVSVADSVLMSIVTDAGTVTPSSNAATIAGGTGINTIGSGDTMAIALDSSSQASLDLADSALQEVVDDTTPQLGGDLDTNGNTIGFDDDHGITDENGNEQIWFQTTASAVNFFEFQNSAAGNALTMRATGEDADVDLTLGLKGEGVFRVAANNKSIDIEPAGSADGLVTTITPSTTSSNKTITLPDATDTLVGRSTTDTLINKDIDADNNTISNLAIGAEVTGASTDLTDTADIAYLATIASTSNGDGAALIGIEDSGGLITATTVEGALAENRTAIDALEAAGYITASSSDSFSNKTIDGDNNTISNLDIGLEVDWASAGDVSDAGAFESGDKMLILEAGVGLRKIDYDDLPSGGGSGGIDFLVAQVFS